MAARLGNVIYWTCSGVAALWLIATAAFVVNDVRDYPAATKASLTTACAAPREGYPWEPPSEVCAGLQKPSRFDPSTAVLAPWWEQDTRWQPPLFLGLIPALVVWLFGRACRYVLAG